MKLRPTSALSLKLETRFEGPVALNEDALQDVSLIAFYETVMRRAAALSIDIGVNNSNIATNDAILRVATSLADLYMILANEAYSDALDPTIGISTEVTESVASGYFAFATQLDNLLEEELALLRGLDGESSASLTAPPQYNRLTWNFTGGVVGEPSYVASYGLFDDNLDGVFGVTDAQRLFPQGHGDAWGHYLTAQKVHLRLMRPPRLCLGT